MTSRAVQAELSLLEKKLSSMPEEFALEALAICKKVIVGYEICDTVQNIPVTHWLGKLGFIEKGE